MINGDHFCDAPGCAARAPFGFADGKDKPPLRFCRDHRWIGQARMAPAVVEPGPASVPPKQGSLL